MGILANDFRWWIIDVVKAKTWDAATRLEEIPNIGASIAKNLCGIGVETPEQLRNEDGLELYLELNAATGVRHDPCVADVFIAAVDFMNGGEVKPWWSYTAQRKRRLKN